MKQLLYLSIFILLSSCGSGQLFVDASTTYNIPLSEKGFVDTDMLETQYKNHSGLNNLYPQIRITYRHYIFDNKKYDKTKQYKIKR